MKAAVIALAMVAFAGDGGVRCRGGVVGVALVAT